MTPRISPYNPPPMTPLQQALDAAADAYRDSGRFLIWHGDPFTGEYTGFSIGGLLRRAEQDAEEDEAAAAK